MGIHLAHQDRGPVKKPLRKLKSAIMDFLSNFPPVFLTWFILMTFTEVNMQASTIAVHQILTGENLKQLMTQYSNVFLFFCSESNDQSESTGCQGADNLLDKVVNVLGEYQQYPVRGYNFGLAKAPSDSEIAKYYKLRQFPTMLYMRQNQNGEVYGQVFQGDMADKDMDEMYVNMWMRDNARSFLQELNQETFEHLTQAASGATTGDWLILFWQNSSWAADGPLRLALDSVSAEYKHQLSVAFVDTQASPDLAKRLKIPSGSSWTIRYFRLEKMYYFQYETASYASLKSFVTGGFRDAKSERVPQEATPWDKMLEDIVSKIKQFGYPKFVGPLLLFVAITAAVSILVILACCASKEKPQDTKFKKG